jgi:carboxyl-terminal processing protease
VALEGTSATFPPDPLSTQAPQRGVTAESEPSVYIPPQCVGTPIATLQAPTAEAGPAPALPANPPLSPELQLEVLRGLANTVRDHYIYPEAAGGEWQVSLEELGGQIEAGLDTEAFYAAMQSAIQALGDEHSYFETPAEVAQEAIEIAGQYDVVGVGALFDPSDDNTWATVLAVLDGGPAWHAGLDPHDALLAVDGGPIRDAAGVSRTRGPECTAVVLTVRSPGQSPRDLTVIRASVSAPMPIYPRLVATSDGSRVGYIFLPTLGDRAIADTVGQSLETFGALDALIIDNRMNPGGISSASKEILGFFVSGTVGEFATREAIEPWEIIAEPIHNSQQVPLIVLVGEDTVSYGEIVSGVLQDLGRARVIGQTTLGNVEQLRRFDFEDGSRVWLASATFEPANAQADWEITGIVPDVEVIADWGSFTFETDPAIAAALELLGHE